MSCSPFFHGFPLSNCLLTSELHRAVGTLRAVPNECFGSLLRVLSELVLRSSGSSIGKKIAILCRALKGMRVLCGFLVCGFLPASQKMPSGPC